MTARSSKSSNSKSAACSLPVPIGGERISDQWTSAHSTLRPHLQNASASAQELQHFFSQVREQWRELRIDRVDPARILDELILQQIDTANEVQTVMLSVVDAMAGKKSFHKYADLLTNALSDLLCFKYPQSTQSTRNALCVDHYRYLLRELFLNLIAGLLSKRKFHAVNHLLECHYLIRAAHGPAHCLFLNFDSLVISLDEYRKRRLDLNEAFRPSVDKMITAAEARGTDLKWLAYADWLLCLRSYLHGSNAVQRWLPVLLLDGDHDQLKSLSFIDLFAATEGEGDDINTTAKTLLGVIDRDDLVQRCKQVQRQSSPQLSSLPVEAEVISELLALFE